MGIYSIASVHTPVFLWHETTVEEAQKACIEENADIEVAIPISKFVEITGDLSKKNQSLSLDCLFMYEKSRIKRTLIPHIIISCRFKH